MTIRIGAIHALPGSVAPIESAFERLWPEAEVVNLLDESLYLDYARWGRETDEITRRVTGLIQHSVGSGAEGILFSGSLFSQSVQAARTDMSIPVLTAYEAMIEAAVEQGNRLGVLTTVADTILSIERDVTEYVEQRAITITLQTHLVDGAMDALRAGDNARHDELVAEAAAELEDCQALMLAQHSMGRARHLIADVEGRQVLTSPDTAALKLKHLLT